MSPTASLTRIPCDTERLYHARSVLQSPETSPDQQASAAAALRKSRDWRDLALVQHHRERCIAATRVRAAEAAQEQPETLVIPIKPQAEIIDLSERRAIRRLTMIAGFLTTALLATAFGSAATVTIAATTAQVEAWRAVR